MDSQGLYEVTSSHQAFIALHGESKSWWGKR